LRPTTARTAPPAGPGTTESASQSSSERSRINNKFDPELEFPPQLTGNGLNATAGNGGEGQSARPLPVLNSDEEYFGAVSSDDDDRFFDSRINILGGSSANIVQATVVEDLNFAR
jgi:hypothetical protein